MSGLFLSFEGIDGSGKTTQVERIVKTIRTTGRDVVSVREPGSTSVAERVRSILLDRQHVELEPLTELLLYLACRAELVARTIRPALEQGGIVVTDRYADSTMAYQGCGRELGVDLVRQANQLATAGLTPDITFLIDLPVTVAVTRRRHKGNDRLESEALEFHERVRKGFLDIACAEHNRVVVIDGTVPQDEVTRQIIDALAIRVPYVLTATTDAVAGNENS
jgi:dTMP kinase